MILLDTNMAVALMNGHPALVRLNYRTAIAAGESVAVSTIVVFELQYGVAGSQHRDANAERLRRFLAGRIETIDFAMDDASGAGDVRAVLAAAGMPIGPYEVLIAGQALCRGAKLATRNTREFSRVPELRLEDWTAGP